MGFCHFCCNLEPHCRCVRVSQSAPPMSWSQIAEQTPGYGVTTFSSGVTTPSTSLGGMSEYVAPLPGLSIWSMPPLEASIPKGSVVSPRYRPPIRRAAQLRATLSRQAPVLQAPQMAPPIHQPLPFPRGKPATLYQQAVQPPGKSSGLGVTFDSSTTKPAPTGGKDTDVRGKQGTRGRDDNSQPASHSKGVRERSSIRTTNKQTPRQVGECPSGVPRNVPPALTPESTPPQCGGGVRAPPKDPLKDATNYKSARWRKDLEQVLKAYYKHNFASFKEADWAKLKDKFFKHLIQRPDEWRSIKENHSLQYMPYMEKHFHAAIGIKLKGLSDFTGWIKCGSYYHALVARKGQLHKCPHLVGVELPRWPQVTPRPAKCRRSASRRWEGQPTLPFPLQDNAGRCASVQQLYQHTGEQPRARHNVATQGMIHQYPDMEPREARSLRNQVLCMIAEYHLTGLAQGSSSISLVLLEAAKDLLPPVEDYLADGEFQGTRDVRVVERAKTL